MELEVELKKITSADYSIYISSFGLVLTFHLYTGPSLPLDFLLVSNGKKTADFSRRHLRFDGCFLSYEAGSAPVGKLLKKRAKTRGTKTKLVSET